jgi:hypothetical protein
MVELLGRHLHRLFNLISIGKTLAGEGIAAEETPPAFLEIEPACAFGNEDVLEARVVCQPDPRLQAIVTAQVISDDEDVARRIIRIDVLEQLDVILGIARCGTAGNLPTIAYTQRAGDPRLVVPTALLQWRLDSMPIRRPARRGGKGARGHRSEFISTDGRRSRWWLRGVGDDRRPFGTNSLSSLLPQLWVRRQRLPSRR